MIAGEEAVKREPAAAFEHQCRQKKDPERTLIKDQAVRGLVKPSAERPCMLDTTVAEKIGQGLDHNKADHAKGGKAGKKAQNSTGRANSAIVPPVTTAQ